MFSCTIIISTRLFKLRVHKKKKRKKLEWRRARDSKNDYGPLPRLTFIILLWLTNTHAYTHTHAHKSILSKIIFFKCVFEQELLHEKLNYLNTHKRQQITLN